MIINRNQRIDQESLNIDETIFAIQNKTMGIRGNFEEGVPYLSSIRGTYINGIYDSHPIPYGEKAHGLPALSQTIVNLPDGQSIQVFVNERPINLEHCKLIDLQRSYHLHEGFTWREVTYETPEKHQFKLTFKRLAHLRFPSLLMIQMQVESINYDGPITVVSRLDGNVKNFVPKDDDRAGGQHAQSLKDVTTECADDQGILVAKTSHTDFQIVVGLTHREAMEYQSDATSIKALKTFHIAPHQPFNLTKYVLYYNSRDHQNPTQELLQFLKKLKTYEDGFLFTTQKEALRPFIAMTNIKIDDVSFPQINETIQYNLYQLYLAGGHSPAVNIAAKGLTGEGYEGHAFWDTEIYYIPYLMQVDPERARYLLENRHLKMAEARVEAEILGAKEGVKFPWRTINGQEASPYYPAGQAQFHINGDIAYAVIQYYQFSQDLQFMEKTGWPLLIETARFFKSIIHEKDGSYHLLHVTGPDEYTAVVDDNYYTNSLLKYQLEFMVAFHQQHREFDLRDDEAEIFKNIAENIHLPFADDLGIDAQDASFLQKPEWPLTAMPETKKPLLLHYHPLVIYRHQVLKQADTILSHVLLHDRPLQVMERSYDYYKKRTTHDSSLSYCIHSLQAARLGRLEEAYAYFKKTVSLDLDNAHGNTQHGLHMANIGGIYLALLYGFIGFQIGEPITLHPQLPKSWQSLTMRLRTDPDATIDITMDQTQLHLTASKDMVIRLYGQLTALIKEKTLIIEAKI